MVRRVVHHESEVPIMKTIGVIGGFGQWATLDFLERIYHVAANRVPQYGNRGYPKMIIHMLNRAPMKLRADGGYPEKLEPSEELIHAFRQINQDSDFIVMPSNTPHLFSRELEGVIGPGKLLSIVDVTVLETIRRGCTRVGVMSIGLTIDERLYQEPLAAAGIQTVELPRELITELDDEGIYPLQEGANLSDIKPVAQKALQYLREQRVDGTILGCTEIPILLGHEADSPDILNPSQLLADAAIERALV